jgi:metacaspase-1
LKRNDRQFYYTDNNFEIQFHFFKKVNMAKKALCVGINDYPFENNDLNGCVNDAKAWADLLVDHYGFDRNDVTLLLDSQATKKNILAALDKLVNGAQPGDLLVFTNSSHGTYVADKDGDEKKYDEAMCPVDCSKVNLIVDDELRVRFSKLTDGVSFTVISDSCHSGTVTRAPEMRTPDNRRMRFLNPQVLGMKTNVKIYKAKPKAKEKYPESEMKEVLLSGCTDSEYSYDARMGKKYHGAMTYFALKVIKKSKYLITLQQLHKQVTELLEKEGFQQHPQLEGKAENKGKLIFT